jgi:hypothetical protein
MGSPISSSRLNRSKYQLEANASLFSPNSPENLVLANSVQTKKALPYSSAIFFDVFVLTTGVEPARP